MSLPLFAIVGLFFLTILVPIFAAGFARHLYLTRIRIMHGITFTWFPTLAKDRSCM